MLKKVSLQDDRTSVGAQSPNRKLLNRKVLLKTCSQPREEFGHRECAWWMFHLCLDLWRPSNQVGQPVTPKPIKQDAHRCLDVIFHEVERVIRGRGSHRSVVCESGAS